MMCRFERIARHRPFEQRQPALLHGPYRIC
jgi:hypothetical protein